MTDNGTGLEAPPTVAPSASPGWTVTVSSDGVGPHDPPFSVRGARVCGTVSFHRAGIATIESARAYATHWIAEWEASLTSPAERTEMETFDVDPEAVAVAVTRLPGQRGGYPAPRPPEDGDEAD